VTVRRIVAGDEVVEVFALERIFFEREVFVGAQIVNPELTAAASLSRVVD
jgi:hypothetical protein